MPLVNGKYKNPQWVNGGPPAIDAQELNAISDTLESLDAGGGSGGSGRRYARFVIGTSTAGWTAADCDYLCDGTNDNIEIQAAIDALPASGGSILILAGSYHLGGIINIKTKSVSIIGESHDSILIGTAQRIYFFFYVPTQPGKQALFQGLSFEDMGISSYGQDVSVVNCHFKNSYVNLQDNSAADDPSIKLSYLIEGNTFIRNTDGTCIGAILSSNHKNVRITVSGNFFDTSTVPTASIIRVTTIYDAIEVLVYNNTIIANQTVGNINTVHLYSSGVFSGNFVYKANLTMKAGTVSGNCFYNGAIYVDLFSSSGGICTGNYVENGFIAVNGNVNISGNTVLASGLTAGIVVYKGATNAPKTPCAAILNNVIQGPQTGIFLGTSSPINSERSNVMIQGNRIQGTTTAIEIKENWLNTLIANNMIEGPISDSGTNTTKSNNVTITST